MVTDGVCPLCESRGPIGQPCDQRPCQRRGYCFIPSGYAPHGHGEPDPEIGRVVGGHLLVAVLGGGGFGKVYIALQLPLLMRTALKLVLPEAATGLDDALARFEAEARALARLSHPNVVRLLQYGAHAGKPFMVMELVEGGVTLKAELARRAAHGEELEGKVILDILEQLLNGLEAAHALGIIHRDIKPDNLMLQRVPGHQRLLKILDFGLVKELSDGSKTSAALGTPAYMAPEQILRRNLGPWTDLYAVGAVAFELMTGRRAFAGPSPEVVVAMKLDKAADPLAPVADLDIPPLASAFLRKALAFDPEARYRDVPELRAALRAACEEVFSGAPTIDVSRLVTPSEVERARSGEVSVPAEPLSTGPSMAGSSRAQGRRGRWGLVAIGAAVVASAVVALVMVTGGGGRVVDAADAGGTRVGALAEDATASPTADTVVASASETSPEDTSPAAAPEVIAETVEQADTTLVVVPDDRADATHGEVVAMIDRQRRLVATNPWREVPAAPAGTLIGLPDARRPGARATSLSAAAGVTAPTRPYVLLTRAVTGDELALLEAGLAPAGATPVTRIDFVVAERFCASIGARLPSEEEWEWAALSAGSPGDLGARPEWTSSLWRDPQTGVVPGWVTAGGQTYRTIRQASDAEGVHARARFCATGPCAAKFAADRPPVVFRCAADR
ncbi:MAG: protein kinase [Deltaproteobacteria bacterium]|nr:protein kinase [Deltaproteobacteria bacterium]